MKKKEEVALRSEETFMINEQIKKILIQFSV